MTRGYLLEQDLRLLINKITLSLKWSLKGSLDDVFKKIKMMHFWQRLRQSSRTISFKINLFN